MYTTLRQMSNKESLNGCQNLSYKMVFHIWPRNDADKMASSFPVWVLESGKLELPVHLPFKVDNSKETKIKIA